MFNIFIRPQTTGHSIDQKGELQFTHSYRAKEVVVQCSHIDPLNGYEMLVVEIVKCPSLSTALIEKRRLEKEYHCTPNKENTNEA